MHVKRLFRILKEQYSIKKEVVLWIVRTDERPNLDKESNLISFIQITQEIKIQKKFRKFLRTIINNTSIKT